MVDLSFLGVQNHIGFLGNATTILPMTGFRRSFHHAGWGVLLLAGCATEPELDLPVAGTLNNSENIAKKTYQRAESFDTAGRKKKALGLYTATADRFPNASFAPAARFRQAQLLEEDGKIDEAFDAYQSLITRYQGSALYTKARDNQSKVAHAAAEGQVTGKLLWFKPALDINKIVSMLETVRDNAPRSPSAAKAQYAIGSVYERKKSKLNEAVTAYQRVVDDYPRSSQAPSAQLKIGELLLAGASKGNRDNSNLDRALHTFEDLRQAHPKSKSAATAGNRISEIRNRDIQRTFDIGEFYYKKGEVNSATLYYNEVLRQSSQGELHNRAKARLQSLEGSE